MSFKRKGIKRRLLFWLGIGAHKPTIEEAGLEWLFDEMEAFTEKLKVEIRKKVAR